ncbi:NAD(P)-binding domain-containing protein, partial [Aliarcobacter butzleri]
MKFTILGAGWLGFELAKSLKNKYKIVVSSRDEEKLKIYEDEGFSSYILNEQNFDYIEELLNTDFLFINFPPSKFENYLLFLEKIYSSK